ncbi:pilus assembly protein TadE [Novosphingobium sp. 1949]|uniref:Pilus assembly protein TadE n=1 Tax=Novosphingobium organovorum TaxID=2930092 RepID=A0ABT0B9B6_9SPHN|nr:pilus assembly protein TadE [Novosphingobium organovorum]MCJ2181618.1 pilus assembly protein TadE [Novosphingobium organovorum]
MEIGRDTRGVSLIELAIALPVLLTLGLYGGEMAYMTMTDMQVSMLATSLADNASRLGQTDNSSVTPTVTETEINSIMTGALTEGSPFYFENHGRIILSSLEYDSDTGGQYIHWQRCSGELDRSSAYGEEGDTVTSMGASGHTVTASSGSAVMFVEVYYNYQPLFGNIFVKDTTFYHEAAFLIRDDRNLTSGVTGSGSTSDCS